MEDAQKKDFIEYLKKYSKKHQMDPFDACDHMLVKEYAYYLGLTDNDILTIKMQL